MSTRFTQAHDVMANAIRLEHDRAESAKHGRHRYRGTARPTPTDLENWKIAADLALQQRKS